MSKKNPLDMSKRVQVLEELAVEVVVQPATLQQPSTISKEEALQKLQKLKVEHAPQPLKLDKLLFQAKFSAQVDARMMAMTALVELANQSQETRQMLESSLQDALPEIRAKAAKLTRFIPEPLNERTMKRLISLAWDPELLVRRTTAKSLAFHPDPRSIGPLMGLLGTQDEILRELVLCSLQKIQNALGTPPPRADFNV